MSLLTRIRRFDDKEKHTVTVILSVFVTLIIVVIGVLYKMSHKDFKSIQKQNVSTLPSLKKELEANVFPTLTDIQNNFSEMKATYTDFLK